MSAMRAYFCLKRVAHRCQSSFTGKSMSFFITLINTWNSLLPVLLKSNSASKNIILLSEARFPNILRIPTEVTLTTFLRDIKHSKSFWPFSTPFQEGRNFIFLLKQVKWFFLILPGPILAYKFTISMFFVVVPCADVPVTAWINNSVLAISRNFSLFHERQIICDITTVTTVTTRLTVLYTARMVATESFPAFTQFEAVTQTALWTSCTHVLDLSFRSKSAWCNLILELLHRSVTPSLRGVRVSRQLG